MRIPWVAGAKKIMDAISFQNVKNFRTSFPFTDDLVAKLKKTGADVLIVEGIADLKKEYSVVLEREKIVCHFFETQLVGTGTKITNSFLNPSRGSWDLVFELEQVSANKFVGSSNSV